MTSQSQNNNGDDAIDSLLSGLSSITSSRSTSSSSSSSSTTTTSKSTTSSSSTSSTSSTSSSSSSSSTSSTTSSSSSSSSATSSNTSSSGTSSTATSAGVTTTLSTETSNGGTSVVVVTTGVSSSAAATQSSVNDSSSGGFFSNKGAEAGVFAVVGIVALIIAIVLATQCVRRRRAKKFDDEVAAAAAEANNSARYPFDEYDDPAPGGGGAYAMSSKYSDPESHGTLNQQPMSHETYGMQEYNQYQHPSYNNVAAGVVGAGAGAGISHMNNTGEFGQNAGIAGFGAGTSGNTSHMRSISPGQAMPYNAFNGVDANGMLNGIARDPYDPFVAGSNSIQRQGSRGGHDMFEAAVAAATGGAAGAAVNRGPSQNTQGPSLDRNHSMGTTRTGPSDNQGGTQESYAAHYQPDFVPQTHEYHSAVAPAVAAAGASGSGAAPAAEKDTALPNPFAIEEEENDDAYAQDSYFPAHGVTSDDHAERASVRDEEDYGRGGRTLKVANE